MTLAFFREAATDPDDKNVRMASLETEPTEDTALTDIINLKYLRTYADEQLKKELESVAGVAAIKISGGLEEEIQIEVDQGKLHQVNLDIRAVANRLNQENVNLAGGNLKEGSSQYLVRTLNQFKSIDEIRDVILKTDQGSKNLLKRCGAGLRRV